MTSSTGSFDSAQDDNARGIVFIVALSAGGAGATSEVFDERGDGFFEVVVGLDADKVNGHALEEFLGGFALALCLAGECFAEGGIAGIDQKRFAGFGVFEFYKACGREFHFARIDDGHGENVVALAENLECVFETFIQEVTHHDDDGAAVQNLAGVFEGNLRVGAVVLRLEVENFADEAQYMLAAFFGRNKKFDLVSVNEEADLVVILDGGECEESRERCHDFAFHLLARTKFGAAGCIDHEEHGHFAFFDELFDVRRAGSGGHVPVNRAHVIAGHVFANFAEFHTVPFEGTVVSSGHHGVERAAHRKFNAANGL